MSNIKLVAHELLDKIKKIVEGSVNWIENTTVKSLVQNNIYSFLYDTLLTDYEESDVIVLRDQLFNYTVEHYGMRVK